jgi:hypothetical protein
MEYVSIEVRTGRETDFFYSRWIRLEYRHGGMGFHALKYLPIGSIRRDEAVAQEGAQNSVKKGVHFGTHRSRVSESRGAHPSLTRHSPSLILAYPAREVRSVKAAWCG